MDMKKGTSSTTMLNYYKLILTKVSFDLELFAKEFDKAIKHLLEPEVNELELWVIKTFGKSYSFVLSK